MHSTGSSGGTGKTGGPGSDVRVAVLGAFQASTGDQARTAPTRQVARVGTILAGWPGQLVERDRIVHGVWGEHPPATAANTLQVHMSHLRRMLGAEVVRSTGPHYRLDVNPDAVDATRFDCLVMQAGHQRREGHAHQAAGILTQALALWRGTPYPDVLDPDLQARRARLAELRDQAREDLLDCRVATAEDEIEVAALVADARELVSRHPERDRGHIVLVRALERAGRVREADAARAEAKALGLAIAE